MYYTPETLLNHVFEDLRKLKAPNNTTRRRAAMPMFAGSGTPMRAPPTPPARTPQTSPSTRIFSSPMSGTSASWQRTAKRR
jgi:hypothetical protein